MTLNSKGKSTKILVLCKVAILAQEPFCPQKPTEFCLFLESVVKLLFVAELCPNGVCECDHVD